MPQPDYTFALQSGKKATFNAGEYNPETQQPRYAMTISAPQHVRHEIEAEQLLIRTGDGYLWTWQIRNRSSWPAFIIITRNGELLPYREQA